MIRDNICLQFLDQPFFNAAYMERLAKSVMRPYISYGIDGLMFRNPQCLVLENIHSRCYSYFQDLIKDDDFVS